MDAKAKVKLARSLKSRRGRDKAGLFLLEGPKLVAEGLGGGWNLQYVLVAESKASARARLLEQMGAKGVPALKVGDEVFASLCDTVHSQGILAVVKKRTVTWEWLLAQRQPRLVLVGDRLQDPGNLGTMVRTAAALGADALALTVGSCDPFNEKCVRASAGAVLRLPILEGQREEELSADLARAGLALAVASAQEEGAVPPWALDFRKAVALVLGNEGQGLSAYWAERAETKIGIPLVRGVESLNVAMAGGMILYEAWRQRRTAPST